MTTAEQIQTPDSDQKPLLRGYFHLAAAVAAVVGLVALILLANSARAYAGGVIFAVSLIGLYSTSAIYHTINWGRRMRAVLMRLDHSMIFVLIAGTYTPICLIAANAAWGITILAVVWSVAVAGIVMKVAWPGAPRWLSVGLYIGAGWMGIVAGTQITEWLAVVPIILLATGGVLYSIGGVIYAARRPDPWPRVFGYHEVFHLLVIAASALHYSVIAIYLMPA